MTSHIFFLAGLQLFSSFHVFPLLYFPFPSLFLNSVFFFFYHSHCQPYFIQCNFFPDRFSSIIFFVCGLPFLFLSLLNLFRLAIAAFSLYHFQGFFYFVLSVFSCALVGAILNQWSHPTQLLGGGSVDLSKTAYLTLFLQPPTNAFCCIFLIIRRGHKQGSLEAASEGGMDTWLGVLSLTSERYQCSL